MTATGPRLWADLKAPDQRPSTGGTGRYFSCCLPAGLGDRAAVGFLGVAGLCVPPHVSGRDIIVFQRERSSQFHLRWGASKIRQISIFDQGPY